MEGEREGFLLGGQWKEKEKVLCLVANGRKRIRFSTWWPMEGEGEGFLLGGQWKEKEKVFYLVANGRKRKRFSTWWPMEREGKGSLLGGQWKEKEKVFFLVANGRRKRRFFSTSSHFPPKQLHLDLHFLSFDIKFLFYHGPKPLFTDSLPFPWFINYDRIF